MSIVHGHRRNNLAKASMQPRVKSFWLQIHHWLDRVLQSKGVLRSLFAGCWNSFHVFNRPAALADAQPTVSKQWQQESWPAEVIYFCLLTTFVDAALTLQHQTKRQCALYAHELHPISPLSICTSITINLIIFFIFGSICSPDITETGSITKRFQLKCQAMHLTDNLTMMSWSTTVLKHWICWKTLAAFSNLTETFCNLWSKTTKKRPIVVNYYYN